MKMSQEDAVNILKKKLADDQAAVAKYAESIAAAEGEMAETEKSKAADEAYAKALKSECEATAASWEERQKSAADEMAAIEKAKEILATGVKVFVQTGARLGAATVR